MDRESTRKGLRRQHPASQSESEDRLRDSRGDYRIYDQNYSRRRSPLSSHDHESTSFSMQQSSSYGNPSSSRRDARDSLREPHRENYRSRENYRERERERERERGERHIYDRRNGDRRNGGERSRGFTGNDDRGFGADGRHPKESNSWHDLDQRLSEGSQFERLERKLISLLGVPTLEKFPLVKSQWGVKPKGFETVTAQRAKLSGYFPLPSAQGTESKLEELMKSGTMLNDVLTVSLKIEPIDSRAARILVLSYLDPRKVSESQIASYFNKFLRLIDMKGIALDENIKQVHVCPGNKILVEFKTAACATLCMSLDGKRLTGPELDSRDYETTLSIQRPQEYVVQCLPPNAHESEEISDNVVDSPGKLTLLINNETTESQLQDALTEIAPLRAFKLLRRIGTKESVGVAFAEFYSNPKEYRVVPSLIKKVQEYVAKVEQLSIVQRVFFLCLETSKDEKVLTSIQDCFIELKTLKGLVRNKFVPYHAKLKVVELINILTLADFASSEDLEFFKEDIREEASKFGTVVSMRMPQPKSAPTPGSTPEIEPGVGKVFLEFEDESIALKALMGMAGRTYNDRTILCAFFSQQDYINGIF